jgi:hypothetical protein
MLSVIILNVVMLGVLMLSLLMLSVLMLSVLMLSVTMLNVVALIFACNKGKNIRRGFILDSYKHLLSNVRLVLTCLTLTHNRKYKTRLSMLKRNITYQTLHQGQIY